MTNGTQLQTSVLAELNWDPSLTAAHIGVTASRGLVSRSGHVDSYGRDPGDGAADRDRAHLP